MQRMSETRPIVRGTKGCVTSSNYLATTAGFEILLAGGNAFDAAADDRVGVTRSRATHEWYRRRSASNRVFI